MRSGGANYRDEDRLVHMMRTIIDSLPEEPTFPDNMDEFV